MPVIDIHCHAFNSQFPWTGTLLLTPFGSRPRLWDLAGQTCSGKESFPRFGEPYIEAMETLGVD